MELELQNRGVESVDLEPELAKSELTIPERVEPRLGLELEQEPVK